MKRTKRILAMAMLVAMLASWSAPALAVTINDIIPEWSNDNAELVKKYNYSMGIEQIKNTYWSFSSMPNANYKVPNSTLLTNDTVYVMTDAGLYFHNDWNVYVYGKYSPAKDCKLYPDGVFDNNWEINSMVFYFPVTEDSELKDLSYLILGAGSGLQLYKGDEIIQEYTVANLGTSMVLVPARIANIDNKTLLMYRN